LGLALQKCRSESSSWDTGKSTSEGSSRDNSVATSEDYQNLIFKGKEIFHTFGIEPDISYLLDLSPETLDGRQQDSHFKTETEQGKEIQIEWSSPQYGCQSVMGKMLTGISLSRSVRSPLDKRRYPR
jgi:hypothetical protein